MKNKKDREGYLKIAPPPIIAPVFKNSPEEFFKKAFIFNRDLHASVLCVQVRESDIYTAFTQVRKAFQVLSVGARLLFCSFQ